MNDFTLRKYGEFLQAAADAGVPLYGVRDWFANQPSSGILMRHDVDRRPFNSLKMAELEHNKGQRTTYYFRITPNSFHPQVIKEIAAMGHEVGYHYEDLSLAKGDPVRALELFCRNLERIREHAPVDTIAMHGRPLSPHDNRTLWEHGDYRHFGVQAEALLSLDYSGVYYITDTGRTWSETGANLRDRVPNSLTPEVRSTDDLVRLIRTEPKARFAVVCHPERWEDHPIGWSRQWALDTLANFVKLALRSVRKPPPLSPGPA